MFYTIYQITNLINGKIYIGKHQTKNIDDDYMGSGKRLYQAKRKYGIENFKKEILFVFETEEKMNDKEKELVTEEFCMREDTYNLCVGGKGGWGYINANDIPRMHGKKQSNVQRNAARKWLSDFNKTAEGRINARKGKKDNFLGKKHTKETKLLIGKRNSLHQKGNKNSQFGTIWITNGIENRKISKEETLPEGWIKGRKLSKNMPLTV